MISQYEDASPDQIEQVMRLAQKAAQSVSNLSLSERAAFMRTVAIEIEKLGDQLLEAAGAETALPPARLRAERTRTIHQWDSYARACEKGDWVQARIDKPNIRKTMVALGPVVVFGAANFPFAYSTAGGDTASAFAAGCPVIVKAHPAHPATSGLMASAIEKAISQHYLPAGSFSHVYGASFEVGKALVEHPATKAVGFTGSYSGGRQIFDWAAQRKEPIPVFAEMSSINPVFLLAGKLQDSAVELAEMYAGSITLGAGQFCTNPGLLIGIESEGLDSFIQRLAALIKVSEPQTMLHTGIFKNYVEKRANALALAEVETVATAEANIAMEQGLPTLASTTAEAFLNNPILHQEVFGPYSLVVRCKHIDEMQAVAEKLEGQLTATIMATEEDIKRCAPLVAQIRQLCGRFILNGVPTGVEVTAAMHHGGPFPASTDSRFTSVGADAIKRFARPLCYQNWPEALLPDELKDANPLKIARYVDGQYVAD